MTQGPHRFSIRSLVSTSSKAAEALQREFAGIFSQETIARYIVESTDLLSGARRSTCSCPCSHIGSRASG